jgi:hypothetical protein
MGVYLSKNSAGHLAGDRPLYVRLCPRLESEDAFDFWYREHETPLDTLPQRHRRNRTRPASADQPKLNNTVFFIEIDEFDVASVAPERWPNILENFLDLVAGGNGFHAANLAGSKGP